MSRLAITLLGPPRIELDGEELHIPRRKAVALLAYLAVEPGRHSRDALATLFWPEYDQSGARGRLRRTLSSLNRALGKGWLVTDRDTAALNHDADLWLDVGRFRQLLATCEAHAHPFSEPCPECLINLTEAAELYREDFMSGFSLPDSLPFDEWQRHQTEKARHDLGDVLERLSACHAAQREYEPAIATAQRWLELDELREAAHRRLMELYARAGQQTAALRQYQLCERLLADELSVTPASETAALYERIRAGEETGWEREVVAPIPHNLPSQPTPFVGREAELAELEDLIASPDKRLVTILGPGGIGKTRLALALAERHLSTGVERDALLSDDTATPIFPDGVYLVPLAGLSAADQIVPGVADALGFRLGGNGRGSRTSKQQVLDYLREKRLLLILDNFEHLLEGVDLIAEILRTAPEAQVLATSRERLHLHEEHVCAIHGLDYPDWERPDYARPMGWARYAAVQLFLNTARRIDASFALSSDDVASLTHICRSLEGMPLGIELAAGWVDVLSLADIAAEIRGSLGFLETEWRDVPARHRSMHAVFDSTWRRLSEVDQDRFAQLSVFRGEFARTAAREVAGADLRALARLVGKSLLQFNRAQERYTMHELLRQFGADKLAAHPAHKAAARDRHSTFYCTALGRFGDHWNRGEGLEEALDIEADWANVWTAWEWTASQGNAARIDLALDGLACYAWRRYRNLEGEAMFQRVVDGLTARSKPLAVEGQRVLAKALLFRSDFNAEMGRWELARAGIQQSKALLDDPALNQCDTRSEQAWLHISMARAAAPDWEMVRWHLEQALKLQRELGYDGQVPYRLLNIAWANTGLEEYDRARQGLEESLVLFRTFGDHFGVLQSLLMLGRVEKNDWDRKKAKRAYEESLSLARALGERWCIADTLGYLGNLALAQGDFQTSASYLSESAAVWRVVGNREHVSMALTDLGAAFWFCGEFDQAHVQIEEGLAIAGEREAPYAMGHAIAHRAWLDVATGRYDAAKAHAQKTVADFQVDTFPGALTLAHGILGWAALAEQRYAAARQPLLRSITAIEHIWYREVPLEYTAWSLAALGRAEYGLGNQFEAKQHLLEALQIAVEIRAFIPVLHLIPIVTLIQAEEDDVAAKERAVELHALSISHPFLAQAQLFEDIAWRQVRAATAVLPSELVEAAQARGRALDWWETAEKLLVELRELGWASSGEAGAV